MKKIVTFIVILTALFSFQSCDESTPSCIEERIDEFTRTNDGRGFTFIYEFTQDGEQYHVFDNGIAFDAIATVVNSSCETVCSYGGFRANNPDPCTDFQESINNAKQIWPE